MEIELSIIIPTYNAEKSIEACMDNLITGLEKLDKTKSVEVIVVNDGSTDRTEEKLKQYIHNVYFKLINKKNGGVSSARNAGIAESRGKHIYFADADDIVHVDTLCRIMNFQGNDIDLIVANYEEINLLTQEKTKIDVGIEPNIVYDRLFIEKDVLQRYFEGQVQGLATVWNKLYKTEIAKKIRFDEKRTHGEDWKFNIEYLKQCTSLYAVSDVLYLYRKDGNQTYNKYRKNIGYCLIDGHKIAKELNEKYHWAARYSNVYNEFMWRFFRQSINFFMADACSETDKKKFVKTKEQRALYIYLFRMKVDEILKRGYSRRFYLACLLFLIGKYYQAIKYL